MPHKFRSLTFTVPWNLFLITVGAGIAAVAIKAVALPKALISGGMSGLCLLLYYFTGRLTPGQWYLLINVPIFLVAWRLVSRRFFFYSAYGMAILSLGIDLVNFQVPIHDPMLAAIAGGAILGAGGGIVFHSVGSCGGNDVIAVLLNQRFNLRMGSYFFIFNLVLFALSLGVLEIDLVLYSLVLSFVASQVIDHVLTLFNQRKIIFIISDRSEPIAEEINQRLRRGGTFLYGRGTFTQQRRRIVMTVLNNFELKRMEEIVFRIDPEAFVVIENTFNVLGRGFSKRKVY